MKDEKAPLKEIELRLISELMKNSRRSDRELARVLEVSQPTVTRVRNKIEKERIVREYTVIPDFNKIGFSLLSVTLTKLKEAVSSEEIDRKRDEMSEIMKNEPIPIILHMNGMGFGADKVIVALHTDYTSYRAFKERLNSNPLLKVQEVDSFLVDLTDERGHFSNLTMFYIVQFLKKMNRNKS